MGPKNGTLNAFATGIRAFDGPPSMEPNRMNTLSFSISSRALAWALSLLLSSSSVFSTIWRPPTPPALLTWPM